jgi:hypothetical protein
MITAVGSPAEAMTRTSYDGVGNVTKSEYDALNRQTQVVYAYSLPARRSWNEVVDMLNCI